MTRRVFYITSSSEELSVVKYSEMIMIEIILFRSGSAGISTLMRRFLTEHSIYFNRRYRCHGQLFQNKFKSIIRQEDVYLKELLRYIYLNQLHAKIVSELERI